MVTKDNILSAKILLVDDQDIHIRLLEETLKEAGYTRIFKTTDPRKVVDVYKNLEPDLVILDMNMPYMDGFQVMSQVKEIEKNGYIPVIILSGDDSKEKKLLALDSGAKDFINKPIDRLEVLIRIRNMLEVRLLHNQIHEQNKTLEDRVKARTKELYEAKLDVIQRLSRAVECRDSETGYHTVRMSHYSAFLASKIGLSMDDCEIILTASPLHDIGKIGIPDNILLKPGKLNPKEWEIMKSHTIIGGEMLTGGTSKLLKTGQDIAITHHERWDGTGYPYRLAGERIPLAGRICCIADAFDAMTNDRPYRQAMSLDQAIEEIKTSRGTHFDPGLVDEFIEILPSLINIKDKYVDGSFETAS